MKRWLSIMVMTAALTASGCKKDKKTEGDTTGSAAASGSAMAGSGSGTMAGSGSAMAGSGSATMAGSGSATMAGSGSAAEPPRPATVTDELLAKGDILVDHMIKLGKELTAAGADCRKATAAVKAATPAVNAAYKDLEKFEAALDKDPAAKDWLDQHYEARMGDEGDAFMAAAKGCKDDKDFAAAMKDLGVFKKKAKEPPPPSTGSSAPPATK